MFDFGDERTRSRTVELPKCTCNLADKLLKKIPCPAHNNQWLELPGLDTQGIQRWFHKGIYPDLSLANPAIYKKFPLLTHRGSHYCHEK